MYRLVCAGCQGEGKFTCGHCHLVLYCGADCQKKHWSVHRKDCKTPLINDNWKPSWQVERRGPEFVRDGLVVGGLDGKKAFWGNVPAIDVLKLGENEGMEFAGDLSILFAASGDPRNIIKTIASLPEDYAGSLSITANDIDIDIVARNAIIFLTALSLDDVEQAADLVVHVWYSAMLTQSHMKVLSGPVRKLIVDVCAGIADRPPSTVLGKTWNLKRGSLRLVLSKDQWFKLLQYFKVPDGLTSEQAATNRRGVTFAHAQRDYRDRFLFAKPGGHRVGAMKFQQDGIVLPFGCSRDPFIVPNPTIFHSKDWPIMGTADPVTGWDPADVLSTAYGAAHHDVYGKLYTYLGDLLRAFCDRMLSGNISIKLLNVDARDLYTQLDHKSFARVVASNISDTSFLGPNMTVGLLTCLLQSPNVNPHATLLTMFMSVLLEEMTQQEDADEGISNFGKMEKYFSFTDKPQGPNDPRWLLMLEARAVFCDNDKYFDRYMKKHRFADIERDFGVVMKDTHTIIAKWPTRLRKRPEDAGSKEDFRNLLAFGHNGTVRHVEWKRTT